jgi:mRNA interferase MazF
MPNMTSYEFGDVVLVPFPFADLNTTKQRPGVVISSREYNAEALIISSAVYVNNRIDLILVMGVTGAPEDRFATVSIVKWFEAGLLRPSRIKPVIQTITQDRVIKRLGKLAIVDKNQLKKMLIEIIGLGKPK